MQSLFTQFCMQEHFSIRKRNKNEERCEHFMCFTFSLLVCIHIEFQHTATAILLVTIQGTQMIHLHSLSQNKQNHMEKNVSSVTEDFTS